MLLNCYLSLYENAMNRVDLIHGLKIVPTIFVAGILGFLGFCPVVPKKGVMPGSGAPAMLITTRGGTVYLGLSSDEAFSLPPKDLLEAKRTFSEGRPVPEDAFASR